jgi:hypothetical protein
MKDKLTFNSNLQPIHLIHRLPIEFSINERRTIRFVVPSLKYSLETLNFNLIISLFNLTPEKIAEYKMKLPFKVTNQSDIMMGLLLLTEYQDLFKIFFEEHIDDFKIHEKKVFVGKDTILASELQYIVEVILVSIGIKQMSEITLQPKTEEDKQIIDKPNSAAARILAAQRKSEERLQKIKAKQRQHKSAGYALEEILLAINYEFNVSMADLFNSTYYGIIWYFGFVGKVDAHKMNQMVLSSGMSKSKKYSYWLNKK